MSKCLMPGCNNPVLLDPLGREDSALCREHDSRPVCRVLRTTRHDLQEEQLRHLGAVAPRLAGLPSAPDCRLEVIQHADRLQSPEEVLELIRQHHPHVVEAVLPIDYLARLPLQELPPIIRAEMERLVGEDGQVVFEFSHYSQYLEVVVRTRSFQNVFSRNPPARGVYTPGEEV